MLICGDLLAMELKGSLEYALGEEFHVSSVFFIVAGADVLNHLHDVVKHLLAGFVLLLPAPSVD